VKKTFSVLFVCTGNTCRSPLAERILKARIKEKGWKKVRVASAGTGAVEGGPASEGTRKAARKLGISLAGFRSKPLTGQRVRKSDLIITMTAGHKYEIDSRWPDAADRTHVISHYSGSGRGPIRDPVGGSDGVYEQCAGDLSDEISRMLPRLEREKTETRSPGSKG
jgi:protein-tyrosine-phosphatase